MYLVTGATGNVGNEVVRALTDTGEPVRALTHNRRSSGLPAGVETVLAFPVTRLTLAFESLKNQPQSLQSVQGIEYMQRHFTTQPDPIQVVIQHHGTGSLRQPIELRALQGREQPIRGDAETQSINGPADNRLLASRLCLYLYARFAHPTTRGRATSSPEFTAYQ